MYKKCSKCQRLLPISNFNWKYKNIKLSVHCKDCSREYIRNHYNKNRSYYIKKAAKRCLKLKRKCNQYIGNYLLSHNCVDCGEKDIIVLEFDHKERKYKKNDISRLSNGRNRFQSLIDEINQCEVRCANCHRRKTAIESDSWKLKYAPVA